jgi:hypothetical protein
VGVIDNPNVTSYKNSMKLNAKRSRSSTGRASGAYSRRVEGSSPSEINVHALNYRGEIHIARNLCNSAVTGHFKAVARLKCRCGKKHDTVTCPNCRKKLAS